MKETEIDPDQLLALAGDDSEFLKELVTEFRDGSLVMVDEMRSALLEEDEMALAGLLHRLKGSSGSLGLKSLYVICRDLEAEEFGSWQEAEDQRLIKLESEIQNSSQLALDCLVG